MIILLTVLSMILINSCGDNNRADVTEKIAPIKEELLFQYFKYSENMVLKNIFFEYENEHIKYYKGFIYIIEDIGSPKNMGENIRLIKYNKLGADTFSFQLPSNEWILSFETNDSLLLLLCQGSFLIYKFANEKIIFEGRHELINKAHSTYLHNNRLYFYNRFYGNVYDNTKPEIIIFNLSLKKFENSLDFEIPRGSALLFLQPRRTFSIYKDRIILSDLTTYNIRIYNFKKELLGTLQRKPDLWNNDSLVCYEMDRQNNLDKFRANIGKYEFLSSINLVDFLNDSTILVCWNGITHNKFYYDIWKLKSGNWKLSKKDLVCRTYNEKDIFNINYYPIVHCQYKISDGKILIDRKSVV